MQKTNKDDLLIEGKKAPSSAKNLSDEGKVSQITYHLEKILETLELNLPGTAKRVAKMYTHDLFYGLNPENFPKLSFTDISPSSSQEMIIIKDIKLSSTCAHHLVPFTGKVKIGYIPNKKIIGLSKINRIVDFYAKRPQLQEHLTRQIAETLTKYLETDSVAVKIEAKHFCVVIRGIKDECSQTLTHAFKGKFKDDSRKNEFLLS